MSEATTIRPKMPYVSIDIETTGLDPSFCQIVEFGAVFDDWTMPVDKMPKFHRYIVHDKIIGEPFALSMNAAILRRIASDPEAHSARAGLPANGFCRAEDLARQFSIWMCRDCYWACPGNKITPAGKNFAGFDRQFLKPLGFESFFQHRTLDPTGFYWQPAEDEKLPDTKTCLLRAGFGGEVAHTALEDAVSVVRLIHQIMPMFGFWVS